MVLRSSPHFLRKEKTPIISGDRDLLQKAFTNLLLNAIQSLPKGEGAVQVTVSEPHQGKITAAIKDTGCGIPAGATQKSLPTFSDHEKKRNGHWTLPHAIDYRSARRSDQNRKRSQCRHDS